jgi:heme-degrading monooxygenase HmoA
MVLEIADIRIRRGVETIITRAQGFRSWSVRKGIESPDRYVLMIEWATLEDHTVLFRGGPLFAEWRAIVGPFFAAPPAVEHFTLVHGG